MCKILPIDKSVVTNEFFLIEDHSLLLTSINFIWQMGSVATHGLGTVVHCYDSNSARCFGELALM